MKNLVGMLVVLFTVSACGLFSGEQSLSDQYSRLEAGYNATLRVLVSARQLCIEDHKNFTPELCVLDDKMALEVDKVQNKAQTALDNDKLYIEANDDGEARSWMGHFKNAFKEIKVFILKIKEVF